MRNSFAVLVVFGFAPLAWSQETTVENPAFKSWASHKVGTTVTQKMNSEAAGNKIELTQTYKLTAVKADKVTVEVTTKSKIGGMEFEQPAQSMDIEKTVKIAAGQKKEDVEKGKPEGVTSEGEETIKISGKDYKTKWYKYKQKTGDIETDVQSWTCNDMPMLTVKMVMKATAKDPAQNSSTTMEVTEIKIP